MAVLGLVTIAVIALAAIGGTTQSQASSNSQDFVTGSAMFDVVQAHVVVSAHSGPAGEDPGGHFSLDQGIGDIQVWAEVTCLTVAGNLAVIGGETVRSRSGIPAGTGVLQSVQDFGSPGDMDRSQTIVGVPTPVNCALFAPGFQADRGNYVVNDAP